MPHLKSIWRSRPVFITSTFRDMHAERDWLRLHVFPVLEERLRTRFHHLEPIDLRWGVDASDTNEGDRERQILAVCLDEIERSRPYIIGLLGDRYGWLPPPVQATETARRAGLAGDVAGRSVTELEILHGVLRNPDHRRRSWFYFRRPLPYDTMPPAVAARYCEVRSDQGEAEAVQRLKGLKAQIVATLPDRVREYSARWDPDRQIVVGLEEWGARVLEDLWTDLNEETIGDERAAPQTWQEQDRWTLEEFIEGRVRGFVGRDAFVDSLLRFATSEPAKGTAWGRCITGEPGSGKSSLFGRICRLARERDVFVLAHAVGISVRSTQVDWMLRRWIEELAIEAGEPFAPEEPTSSERLDAEFARLLRRVSASRRVVVLLDAINHFEPSARATQLTWLPKAWPERACFVVTANPGDQVEALLRRPGIVEAPLSAINRNEAADIVRAICARYHRHLDQRVEVALLAKVYGGDRPSFGNPLWLELVTEELNLIGSDTFDRSDPIPDADALVGVLLDVVARMPPTASGMYAWMFDRAAGNVGARWTSGLLVAVGVSRAGWRESDFEQLLPVLSGEPWDPLRFAVLRRACRSHLVQRGPHAQWDFGHNQAREAVMGRLSNLGIDWHAVHRAIAEHVGALPADDEIHQTETMLHAMQEGNTERAAQYYMSNLTDAERAGATDVLRTLVLTGQLPAVLTLLDHGDGEHRAQMGADLLFHLCRSIKGSTRLELQLELLKAVKAAIEVELPDEAGRRWVRHVRAAHLDAMSTILLSLGETANAVAGFRQSLELMKANALTAPENLQVRRNLAASYGTLGGILLSFGRVAEARDPLMTAHSALGELVAETPANGEFRLMHCRSQKLMGDLRVGEGRLEEALAEYSAGSATAAAVIASPRAAADWVDLFCDLMLERSRVLSGLDRHEEALECSLEALRYREADALAHPADTNRICDLAGCHLSIGRKLAELRRPGAMTAYSDAIRLYDQVCRLDSDHLQFQRELWVARLSAADLLAGEGDVDKALAVVSAAREWFEQATNADPSNARYRYDLATVRESLGKLLRRARRDREAREMFVASLRMAESQVSESPGNAAWEQLVALNLYNLHQLERGTLSREYLRRSHALLRGMADRGMHLGRFFAGELERLNREFPAEPS